MAENGMTELQLLSCAGFSWLLNLQLLLYLSTVSMAYDLKTASFGDPNLLRCVFETFQLVGVHLWYFQARGELAKFLTGFLLCLAMFGLLCRRMSQSSEEPAIDKKPFSPDVVGIFVLAILLPNAVACNWCGNFGRLLQCHDFEIAPVLFSSFVSFGFSSFY